MDGLIENSLDSAAARARRSARNGPKSIFEIQNLMANARGEIKAQAERNRDINLAIEKEARQEQAVSALIQGSSERITDQFLDLLGISDHATLHTTRAGDKSRLQSTLVTFLCACKFSAALIPYDVAKIIAKMALQMSRHSGVTTCVIRTEPGPLLIYHPHQSDESRNRWLPMFDHEDILIYVIDTHSMPLVGKALVHFEDSLQSQWLNFTKRLIVYSGPACNNEAKKQLDDVLQSIPI